MVVAEQKKEKAEIKVKVAKEKIAHATKKVVALKQKIDLAKGPEEIKKAEA